ncbi:MAG: FHA domain-containing protein, partial [Candidatus Krumholzibacteria bacterium]|nr:FHA domain-containing protein [Candidatus Krumholzibacteria bacterium]
MLHLRVISGSSKGRTVSLDETQLPLTIGRDPENTISLDHTAISRFHCTISTEDGAYYIQDNKSTNGTYLNGRRIQKDRLSPGDELIIANVGIVVEASPKSIYESHAPLDVNVSIDIKSKSDNALTLANPAEEMGTKEFLAGFSDDENSKSYQALQLLYKSDRAFRDIEDLKQLMENLLDLIMDNIQASRGYVFLLQRDTGNLVPYVRRPVEQPSDDAEIVVSQTILQS